MSTPTDYGEPWDFHFDSLTIQQASDHDLIANFEREKDLARVQSAIQACAGMADPEKEIAEMREAKDSQISLLNLLADIRTAVGDSQGKLMQDELVEHCQKMRESLSGRTVSCGQCNKTAKMLEEAQAKLSPSLVKIGQLNAEIAAMISERAKVNKLLKMAQESLKNFEHEDGCFCEAAFSVPNGSHPRHSKECILAKDTLAKLKPFVKDHNSTAQQP